MSSPMTEIANNATYTAQAEAAKPKATGVASKLGSQEFMNLMMKQLQYQDPLEPVSNTEFIAQQAQFSQLSTTQDISDTLANSAGFEQASSLIGKVVTINDPDNKGETKTGLVQAASYNGKDSSIVIGGKEYAMSSVKYVHNTAEVVQSTDGTNSSGS